MEMAFRTEQSVRIIVDGRISGGVHKAGFHCIMHHPKLCAATTLKAESGLALGGDRASSHTHAGN